jgi:hypothetical protein
MIASQVYNSPTGARLDLRLMDGPSPQSHYAISKSAGHDRYTAITQELSRIEGACAREWLECEPSFQESKIAELLATPGEFDLQFCDTSSTLCFLHMLSCVCIWSKAWLYVRMSLWLARTPRPAAASRGALTLPAC